ncbi:late competence development ComFB family protein [Clostridium sp. E02]|uniref:late competence development ComFB family protein n=1 Tax=Clostridium sp. E02 TaxID=2487134 RepID=UPI000F532A7D|nr:late competence development ComFB family protein [Clostridium sp. E02]
MARKSSKTAHVMNLLSGDDSEGSKSEAAQENLAASQAGNQKETVKELTVVAQQASIQTSEGSLSPSPISIIDMTSSVPDPVAELIKAQLEEEEETEESVPMTSEVEPIAEPEAVTAIDVPVTPIDSTENFPDNPSYQFLNIMEQAVKTKAEDYMNRLGMCTCKRCIADVTALTLTNLPSKYIVVDYLSSTPLLNYYINRYSQMVIVEMTKACITVKESPHH